MGKNKNKKGKGIEKTMDKELKKSEKKMRKELTELGQDDMKTIISQLEFQSESIKLLSETKCDPPSPRCNMTLNAHPEKDILIMFGGEYYNGRETVLYNDLYNYHIRSNEWSHVVIPNAPTPRCSHQAVSMPQLGGQLWLFGGEYVTKNQSQFFHYNDLWMLNLTHKTWEKINCPGAPSPRSGHRMVACRKMLFIFGGFQDNTIAYRYYNDIHAFSVETYTWIKLQILGLPPSPRSGCVMAVTQDQCHIMVYGGYSKQKVKKDVDKGCVHMDMFMLSIEGSKSKTDVQQQPSTWKWSSLKQTGHIPIPRCSTSLCVTSSNRAVLFGGIRDEDEDEENVEGSCLDDMYLLEIDRGRWHPLTLKKSTDPSERKKRRRKDKSEKVKNADKEENDDVDDEDDDVDDDDDDDDEKTQNLDRNVKKLKFYPLDAGDQVKNVETPELTEPISSTKTDDVFKVTVHEPSLIQPITGNLASDDVTIQSFTPSPRMRPMLAAKRGTLYLYGGVREVGDQQITLSDFYSIDLQRMNEWNVLLEPQDTPMDWQESSDDEDDSDDDDDDSNDDDDDGESSNDDDEDVNNEEEDEEDPTRSGPSKRTDETFEEYFERTSATWKRKAIKVAEKEGIQASSKQIDKASMKMACEYWQKISF